MPSPEFVSKHFSVQKIVFNNGDFSIAWGNKDDGQKCLAMRWNGDDHKLGFPTSFGRSPLWFYLPPELTLSIVRGLLGHCKSDGFALAEIIQTVIGKVPSHEVNL